MIERNGKISLVSSIVFLVFVALLVFSSCRNSISPSKKIPDTITLDANQKLERIFWKDNFTMWIVTRPMRESESAETYQFHLYENGVNQKAFTVYELRK